MIFESTEPSLMEFMTDLVHDES